MKNFDVNYIVKEQEGIVVCIISDCELNAINVVNSTTGIFDVCCLGTIPEEFFLGEYKGVSKCVPEDTFDVEYGKNLAYSKAYLKYVTALEKKVKYIVKDYKNFITKRILPDYDRAVAKVDGKAVAAEERYNKVLEEAK